MSVCLAVKIAQLDKELKGYKDKLKTTKNSGAKKNLQVSDGRWWGMGDNTLQYCNVFAISQKNI